MAKAKIKRSPVLVTPTHRLVMAGYLDDSHNRTDPHLVLHGPLRCAIRWATTGGFLELATDGPNKNSRLGTIVVGALALRDITSIADLSEEAVKSWGL